MEHKVIQSLAKLDDDKNKFRRWHKKAVGALSQINEEYGRVLERLAEQVDGGHSVEETVADMDDREDMGLAEDLNRDLYALILDKAEGDAAYKKVQSVKRNQGIKGFTILYKWFTEVSGMGLAEQARRLMQPETPKKEVEMAAAIEEWEMRLHRLAAHGKEYELNVMFKIIALRFLTVGRAREYYEMWESEVSKDEKGYNALKNKIKEYSKRKQLENKYNKAGSDAMDCDVVGGHLYQVRNEWSEEGSHCDVDVIQKGKGFKGFKGFKGLRAKAKDFKGPATHVASLATRQELHAGTSAR